MAYRHRLCALAILTPQANHRLARSQDIPTTCGEGQSTCKAFWAWHKVARSGNFSRGFCATSLAFPSTACAPRTPSGVPIFLSLSCHDSRARARRVRKVAQRDAQPSISYIYYATRRPKPAMLRYEKPTRQRHEGLGAIGDVLFSKRKLGDIPLRGLLCPNGYPSSIRSAWLPASVSDFGV